MPHDDWDEPQLPPDWGGGGGYDVQPDNGGSGQMLEQQQQAKPASIRFGDWTDTGTGYEGDTDQDCCDNAKDQFIKGMEKEIREQVLKQMAELEREHTDGQTMDEFFEERLAEVGQMEAMFRLLQDESPDINMPDTEEQRKKLMEAYAEGQQMKEKQLRENVQSNMREKTSLINATECMEFKQMVKELRNHDTAEDGIDLGNLASAVYQEWMDCAGSDFDDDDTMMMGEPMEIAFSLLKSQRLIDTLLKLDWGDEDDSKPEKALDEERVSDFKEGYNSNEWGGPKQHDTGSGGGGGRRGGMTTRDRTRQQNKIARARFRRDVAAKKARRKKMNARDAATTHHPGSILLDGDDIEEDHLPGRLAHDRKTAINMDYRERKNLKDDIDWKQWMKDNPDKLQAILSGEHTLNEIYRRTPDDFVEGEDNFSFGFVHDHTPRVNDIHEAHERGNLPDMTHEINLANEIRGGEPREISEHRGEIHPTSQEEADELRAYLAELSDAPTATRRSATVSVNTDDGDEPVVPGIKQGIPSGEDTTWEGGHSHVERPTWWGVPFNEETGFTTGEPMDIAWDSLLKSSKV